VKLERGHEESVVAEQGGSNSGALRLIVLLPIREVKGNFCNFLKFYFLLARSPKAAFWACMRL